MTTKKTAYEVMLYERGYTAYQPTPADVGTGLQAVFVKQFIGGKWVGKDMEKCPALTCYRYLIGGNAQWQLRIVIPVELGGYLGHNIQFDLWSFTDVQIVARIHDAELMALDAWRKFSVHMKTVPRSL